MSFHSIHLIKKMKRGAWQQVVAGKHLSGITSSIPLHRRIRISRIPPEAQPRATGDTGLSQVYRRSDHADALDGNTIRDVRVVQEQEGCGEDCNPPEDYDNECRVLAGWIHTTRLKVRE